MEGSAAPGHALWAGKEEREWRGWGELFAVCCEGAITTGSKLGRKREKRRWADTEE